MQFFLSYIYKPKRILYYIEANEQNKQDFLVGKMPDSLMQYDGEFGTYDCPGLFVIGEGVNAREVMGIEFRPNDDRINYPKELDSMYLEPEFMIGAQFARDTDISYKKICDCIDTIKNDYKEKTFYDIIKPNPNAKLVQIYTLHEKNRVFIQALPISKDEFFTVKEPVTLIEKDLYRAAYKDFITGHNNWNYINPIMVGYGLMGYQDFCFVHFDVKDFNALNVIYGHGVANDVLRKIAKHMTMQDWIYCSARCDNDNFAMMIKDMPEEEIHEKLMKFFEEISVLDVDKHYKIFYRCGVVPMKNTLLLADRAADGAKLAQHMGEKLNVTEVFFYTDEMHNQLDWAKKIKAYLDFAIERDEFLVYLQPKYDINTEKIKGAEALIRWKYRGGSLISPGLFIPVFEKDGSISKIDDIVLKKVCECLKKWKEEGKVLLPISVNLSRKRMENPNLIEHLTSIVDSYGVDHSLIDFELTESAASDNQDYMIKVISKLKDAGFKVSMDDFGTGFSSLSLLTVMPMDTLKIDKSFVDGIGTTKETYKERAVVQHIISMAKALNLTCLAEGAEEKTQVDKLREFGCDVVQGYYYSKPLPVDEYEMKIS